MLSDLAQGDFDGAGDVYPCAFRGGASLRARPPRPTARVNSWVSKSISAVEPLAAAQVMKFLRLGQFLPQLGQPLLVGRSCLWIKDFPRVAEPLGVSRTTGWGPERNEFPQSLAETRTCARSG